MIDSNTATKEVAAYFPDGKAYEGKNMPEKNLYGFIDAITKSFVLFCQDLDELKKIEMNPGTTEDLISRWEQEYGLPDQCLRERNDLNIRRNNILIKIGMNGVTTIQDFRDLAAIFGYSNISIATGIDALTFPLAFPWLFITEQDARFTLIVDLPVELGTYIFPFEATKFPFPFGSENGNILECVFTRLVGAHEQVIFRYIL